MDNPLETEVLGLGTVAHGDLLVDYEDAQRVVLRSFHDDDFDDDKPREVTIKLRFSACSGDPSNIQVDYSIDTKLPRKKRQGGSIAHYAGGNNYVMHKARQAELPNIRDIATMKKTSGDE